MTPAATPPELDLAAAIAQDHTDPLAAFRDRFLVPDDVIYLDGNSLGVLPKGWPNGYRRRCPKKGGGFRSWNAAGWVDLPARVGARIAGMIGARPDCVIAATAPR